MLADHRDRAASPPVRVWRKVHRYFGHPPAAFYAVLGVLWTAAAVLATALAAHYSGGPR